jgi:hypothetical protein
MTQVIDEFPHLCNGGHGACIRAVGRLRKDGGQLSVLDVQFGGLAWPPPQMLDKLIDAFYCCIVIKGQGPTKSMVISRAAWE